MALGIATIGGGILKALNFAALANLTLSLPDLINRLSGGRLGNIFSGRGNISTFDFENRGSMQGGITSSNIGLNLRLLDAMRKRSRTTAERRKQAALTFLGDRSQKLDDAPDTDMENEQVLQGIANNRGLITPSTVVPAIENPRILEPGFEGVRLEIEKINRNISALKQAMTVSAALEAKYRQSLIEDLEKSLAKKGKDRSETRSERSIFNLLTRPKEEVVKQVGSLANSLTNALMLSLGLEVGGRIADTISKPSSKEQREENLEDLLIGDEDKPKPEGFMRFLTGFLDVFAGELGFDFDNRGMPMGKEIKEIIENKKNQENNLNIQGGENNTNVNVRESSDDLSSNLFFGGEDFVTNIAANTSMIRKPVEAGSGQTQIIDLRTAQNLVGQEAPGSAGAAFDNSIAYVDPERRTSPYEAYVRDV